MASLACSMAHLHAETKFARADAEHRRESRHAPDAGDAHAAFGEVAESAEQGEAGGEGHGMTVARSAA